MKTWRIAEVTEYDLEDSTEICKSLSFQGDVLPKDTRDSAYRFITVAEVTLHDLIEFLDGAAEFDNRSHMVGAHRRLSEILVNTLALSETDLKLVFWRIAEQGGLHDFEL